MRIKRQPFWVAVQVGLWLHLAFAGVAVIPSMLVQGPIFTLVAWSAIIDWIVGSVYSRYYLKTWPVQLFAGALGGFFSNLIARAVAGAAIGMAYFFTSILPENVPVQAGLQASLAVTGTYVAMGVLFGAIGAAWSIAHNKGLLSTTQTILLVIAVSSLWLAQQTYATVSQELYPRLVPAAINLAAAAAAVTIAFYVQDKADGISPRQVGALLLFMLVGFLASLLYVYDPRTCCENLPVTLHGFPFGIKSASEIMHNLLFWFNVALLLTSLRSVLFIRSVGRVMD